jgi:hypothetical protein
MSLAAIGDVNGDTIPDIAVGAPYDKSIDPFGTNPGTNVYGMVYIITLNSSGSRGSVQSIHGNEDELLFGSALAYLGDLDGDSVGSLAVSMQIQPEDVTT